MTLEDFFSPEKCSSCHEDVQEEIKEGNHAGESAVDLRKFDICINCHDPHYQVSFSDLESMAYDSQPPDLKCVVCHEIQKDLPMLSSGEETCMSCHTSISKDDPKKSEKVSTLCFSCHAEMSGSDRVKSTERYPLIDINKYRSTIHSEVSCMVCHPRSAQFPHNDQISGECRQCHLTHDEKIANDAHSSVSCEACHLNQVTPFKDSEENLIIWQKDRLPDSKSEIHQMITAKDDSSCVRCHFKDNDLGASASVLPAKSIICLPCHTATFSIADAPTIIALIIFIVGFISLISIWFSGKPREGKGSFPGGNYLIRIYSIIKAIILDILLQRRLFRVSGIRWLIHSLIFYPLVLRFGYGLIALLSSLWLIEYPEVRMMLDKNHPLTAFLFDVTGVMMILGVICLIIHKKLSGLKDRLEGLPKRDWPAYVLLGAIVLVGFILEGMRIAMTGSPQGSEYAFLGYGISKLFINMGLSNIYGFVWYLHAILSGAFVAYLPFSRMLHMIIAPINLAINAYSRD
ncbi:multiheme c-type cytochrome [Deltaproteobacteria bacterium]|nr:multiheme c-type cytochrome [Deltaproteobacteria bacterium]